MKKTGLLALGLTLFLTACTDIAAPLEDAVMVFEPAATKSSIPNLEFTLPIYPDESLHPTLVENQTNMILSPLLYEGLYVLDRNYTAIPWLVAEESVSEDGLRWVFTLKEGVTFWDGTALTGQIVASALNEARGENSRFSARFRDVNTISGTGNQVIIQLSGANWNLPALLDIPISYGGGLVPKGTGPYVYDKGGSLLARNPLWWGGADLPETILLHEISAAMDMISAFDGGNISLLDGDLTGNQVFGYSGNYQVWEYYTSSLYYMGFNMENSVLDSDLRRVISEGIDRDTLVNQTLAGYGTSTIYPVHPAIDYGLPYWEYSILETVQEFMAYPWLPELELIVNGDNREKIAMAEQISAQLGEFGLVIHVKPLPWADFVAALQRGDFDLYISEIYMTADFDVSSLLLSTGGYNFGRYVDGMSDQLWWNFRAYGPSGEWNFYHYFFQQMPIAPICFENGTALSLWGHLSQVTPTANHLFYGLEHWVIEKEESTG